jgi:Fe-S-cluster containining protein
MTTSISILYQSMDETWSRIAALYQFQCTGCEDNCCKSLFFHHTHIEKAYLRHGFDQLEPGRKNEILSRAEDYCKKTFLENEIDKSRKIICPLNEKGRCILYPYRPMICRLHGLPHEIRKPGFPPLMGEGCSTGQFHAKAHISFDRTPFYQNMARLEADYRQKSKRNGKIKETVAQMLLSS